MALLKLFTTALTLFNSSNTLSKTGLRTSESILFNSVFDCDTTSKFNYLNGTLSPESPLLNENFTLTVGYVNNYQIVNGGTIDYTVNFNGLPYSFTEPICSVNQPCPIELGYHIVSSNPSSLSQIGKLVMTQKWTSDSGDILLCTQTIIKITQSVAEDRGEGRAEDRGEGRAEDRGEGEGKYENRLRTNNLRG
jgi:hypothetical protein